MGGKGYKPYTSLTGKKVYGDWEYSDRGAGNKATRRAGGEVEAKSPTYLAHVHNKGKKKVDPKKNNVTENDAMLATGKMVGKTIGTVTGGLIGGLAGGFPGAAVGAVSGNVVGGKLAPGKPEKKTIVKVKKESFSNWRNELLGEEDYDKMKDARLVNYGIGHDGSDKKGSVKRAPETKVKGKTVLQKETEKKYGKNVSAIDVVRAKIEKEHGKGAIYDGKKK